MFDTKYTPIGALLHSMKYNGRQNTGSEIADMCYDFLKNWLYDKSIDIILPVPPTIDRTVQPVNLIIEVISDYLHIPFTDDVLQKTTDLPSKNMAKDEKQLDGTIKNLNLPNENVIYC